MSSSLVESKSTPKQPSGWISSVLSQAIVFWLRSQVDSIEALEVNINASNRSLLQGKITQVTLKATHGIYQGLHLSQIDLRTSDVQTNLRQILKGQPLKLLHPVLVDLHVCLNQTDLNCSVISILLQNALQDTLVPWLKSHPRLKSIEGLKPQSIILTDTDLILEGTLTCPESISHFQLRTQLERSSPQALELMNALLIVQPQTQAIVLEKLTLDLGSEVRIDKISLASERLVLAGQIQINP